MGKLKFKRGDKVVANEKAPGDYRGRQAIVVQHGPGTAEYAVNFDGQIVYLNSWWCIRPLTVPTSIVISGIDTDGLKWCKRGQQ